MIVSSETIFGLSKLQETLHARLCVEAKKTMIKTRTWVFTRHVSLKVLPLEVSLTPEIFTLNDFPLRLHLLEEIRYKWKYIT